MAKPKDPTSIDAQSSLQLDITNLDIYEPDLRPLQRCDRSTVEFPNPSSVFDYSRFTHFLNRCNELERQERIVAIRHAKKVRQLEYFTDKVLADELSRIYGELDVAAPAYQKIFTNYKVERLEEISEWIQNEEEMIYELHAYGIKVIDLTYEYEEDDKVDLTIEFSDEEFMAFSKVGLGALAKFERFVLPRKEITTPAQAKKLLDLNLAVFDPQLSLSSTAVPDCPDHCNMSEKLISNLQSLVANHVMGISLNSLYAEFHHKFGYELDYTSLGYHDFGALVRDLSHVIWRQELKGHSPILYPKYLEGLICTPDEFFWKILHRLRVVLTLSYSIIPLDDAFKKAERIFGFKISPDLLKAWGFASLEDLAHFLFRNWPDSEIKLIFHHETTSLPKDDGADADANESESNPNVRKILYLRRETEATRNADESARTKSQLKKIPPVEPSEHGVSQDDQSCVPDYCVQPEDNDLQLQMDLVPQNVDKYVWMTHTLNPNNFHVVLVSNWNTLTTFCDELRMFYERDKSGSTKANPKLLVKGMLIVAKSVDDGETQYYRARYNKKMSETKHKVTAIDYGYQLIVEEDGLFYIPKYMASHLPAQAIPCSLYNVSLPQPGMKFDESVNRYCHQLLSPTWDSGKQKTILASFRSQIRGENGERKWLTRVVGADRPNVPDVGTAIMGFIAKTCTVSSRSLEAPRSSLNNPAISILHSTPKTFRATRTADNTMRTTPPRLTKALDIPLRNTSGSSTRSNGERKPVPDWITDRKKEAEKKNKEIPATPAKSSWAHKVSFTTSNTRGQPPASLSSSEDFPSLLSVTKPMPYRKKKH